MPHVLACKALIEQWAMTLPEAAELLNVAGDYLREGAQYEQAEPLYQRALDIRERALGPEHPLRQLASATWLSSTTNGGSMSKLSRSIIAPMWHRRLCLKDETSLE